MAPTAARPGGARPPSPSIRHARLAALALLVLIIPAPILLAQATGLEPAPIHLAQATSLEPVIVTEGRIPEALSKITRSVDVAGGEEIRRSGADSLADYMSRLGFQVRSSRGANYGDETITIRGLSTSVFGTDLNTDVLVLVDGRRAGSDSLSLIDLNMIERVEVIRGPGAVQYGSSAMGGVVNVITVRGSETAKARLEAGFGSFGAREAAASASGVVGRLDLAAGISWAEAGDYSDGRGHTWPHSSMGGRLSWMARAGWSLGDEGRHRIGATVQGTRLKDLGGLVGASASSLRSYVQYQDKTLESLELLYEGASPGGRLSWRGSWFTGRTGYVLNRHPGLAGRPGPSYVGAETVNDFEGAQAQLAFGGPVFSIVVGADRLAYDFTQVQAATTSSPKTTGESLYSNLGLYALMKIRPLDSDRLVLSAGLRRDHYRIEVDNLKGALGANPEERSEADLEFERFLPSVGASFAPAPWLRLKANYAVAYKVPSPRQLTGNYYMGSTLFVGDMGLRPETAKGLDAAADITLGPLAASVGWFRTDYENLISFERISNSPPVSRYLNVAEAVIEGLELKIAADLAPALDLPGSLKPYASLTRLTSYKSGEGKLLPDIARDSLSLGLDFEHQPLGLSVDLEGTYLGPIAVAGGYASQTPSGRTGGVMIWDLAVSKRLFEAAGGETRLKLTLKNVLDKYYDTSDGDFMPGASYKLSLIWER